MVSKARQLNEQQEIFLNALAEPENKGDIRKAMNVAGYAKSYTITHITQSLGEEMLQVARDILKQNSAKAALGLVSVLDGDSGLAAREKIQAAEKILDRVGIVKKDQVEITSNGNAIFILPAKRQDVDEEIY